MASDLIRSVLPNGDFVCVWVGRLGQALGVGRGFALALKKINEVFDGVGDKYDYGIKTHLSL